MFDRTTKFHAALVFLLTTGLDCAVALFVRPGHFESPNASTGASRCANPMTAVRHCGNKTMNPAALDG
ncbi:hypothetical protein [Pseudomonas protegens]|uniref:hypothetical protein n=1 Tax=Pseudomonas protegens TaxID=380021 RepID=UPI0021ABE89B|nr:hypothetical protein [Pseudomonas protegens]